MFFSLLPRLQLMRWGRGVCTHLTKMEKDSAKALWVPLLARDLINTSNYHNRISFNFAAINRGPDAFPANLHKLLKRGSAAISNIVTRRGVVRMSTSGAVQDGLNVTRISVEVADCPRLSTLADSRAVLALRVSNSRSRPRAKKSSKTGAQQPRSS